MKDVATILTKSDIDTAIKRMYEPESQQRFGVVPNCCVPIVKSTALPPGIGMMTDGKNTVLIFGDQKESK